MSPLLPADFSDLEPLVADWALPNHEERYAKRVGSSMAELQDFYDRMFPRAEAAIAYLDGFDVGKELPDDAERLLQLVYALITVSIAVEYWKQPRVVDSGENVMIRVE